MAAFDTEKPFSCYSFSAFEMMDVFVTLKRWRLHENRIRYKIYNTLNYILRVKTCFWFDVCNRFNKYVFVISVFYCSAG